MTKASIYAFVTVLYIAAEIMTYSIVSISGKSFSYRNWSADHSSGFAAMSILLLVAWIIVMACVFFNEIKPKK